ncbi:MAG: SigE family RNA polymerase sigma factor [Acidimicrobiales bacterium]|nr:SigE family RNA polymerase sigma factor [Acidimicrobiales bacterium]
MSRETSDYADEFDAFFDDHYPAMIRSLSLITGDEQLAADAVQDAFVRAYSRWNRIRRYDRPDAWVRRVAINRSKDHFRAASRRRTYEERAAVPESVPSTDHRYDDGELVHRLLADLPRRQRVAVTLFYLEGLSVAEIAASMGITSGAVKFHLSKGRARMAPVLREEVR